MARKRPQPPKPERPASVPFPDADGDGGDEADLMDALRRSAAVVGASRLLRLSLCSARIKGRPDAFTFPGPLAARLKTPDVKPSYEPERGSLQVVVGFELRAGRDEPPARGRKPAEGEGRLVEMLVVQAEYFLEFEFDPGSHFTDDEINAFCDAAAVTRAWPYWRDYVRDAISRLGFPPLEIPHDIVF